MRHHCVIQDAGEEAAGLRFVEEVERLTHQVAKDAAAHITQRPQADPGQAVDVCVGEQTAQNHDSGDEQGHPKEGVDLGPLSDGGPLHDVGLAELPLERRVADLADQQEHGAVHGGEADAGQQSEDNAPLVGSQIGDKLLKRPPALREESGEEKSLAVLQVQLWVRILRLGHEPATLHGEMGG